jgi:peptidoglycan L-alanyl-D-glutamate endopeptidase CwlK
MADYKKIGLGLTAAVVAGWGISKLLEKVPPGLAASQPIIDRLDPSIQSKAKEVLIRANNIGIPLVITQGLRTSLEQQKLYDQGRTTPGPIVTKAKPGISWHNYGLAFDVAVLKDGKATWPNDNFLWNRIGMVGKTVGLQWGGDFTTIKDLPHFEFHPDMSIADAKAGKRPGRFV